MAHAMSYTLCLPCLACLAVSLQFRQHSESKCFAWPVVYAAWAQVGQSAAKDAVTLGLPVLTPVAGDFGARKGQI